MDVNTERTKLLVQHASNRPQHIIPTVQANTRIVDSVPSFSYLGSLLSSVATCEGEIQNRIRTAHMAYGRLTKRVFEKHGLNFQTKVMVLRAVVLSTLLYACETRTIYSRDVKQLEKFQQAKLRQIIRVRWKDKIANNEILTRASLPSIEAIILQHRLRWVGHIACMPPTRLPKIILYGELAEGKRPIGGPRHRFKDQLKRSLAQANIPDSNWEKIAHERHSWKVKAREGVEASEADRRSQVDLKRQERKRRQVASPPLATLPCDYCPRLFRHRLGLLNHVRVHKRHQKDS